VVKTVAGFLNSRYGGTLLIGVADDGSVLCLDADYKTLHTEGRDDADTFQLHLTQLVERAVGLAATANVTTQVHVVDGRALCHVHGDPVTVEVSTASGPVPKFFVRINNSTKAFDDETERQRYLAQRWGGGG
jgi:predicted HTH transcriptional regulator